MMRIVSIKVPYGGFKIKSKKDAKLFCEELMSDGELVFIVNDIAYRLNKKGKQFSVKEKWGDLYDPFNPQVEVANTENSAYKETVYDYVYKLRKHINERYFS